MLSVKTSCVPTDAHRDIVLDAISRETDDYKKDMEKRGKEYVFTLSVEGVEFIEAIGATPAQVGLFSHKHKFICIRLYLYTGCIIQYLLDTDWIDTTHSSVYYQTPSAVCINCLIPLFRPPRRVSNA